MRDIKRFNTSWYNFLLSVRSCECRKTQSISSSPMIRKLQFFRFSGRFVYPFRFLSVFAAVQTSLNKIETDVEEIFAQYSCKSCNITVLGIFGVSSISRIKFATTTIAFVILYRIHVPHRNVCATQETVFRLSSDKLGSLN